MTWYEMTWHDIIVSLWLDGETESCRYESVKSANLSDSKLRSVHRLHQLHAQSTNRTKKRYISYICSKRLRSEKTILNLPQLIFQLVLLVLRIFLHFFVVKCTPVQRSNRLDPVRQAPVSPWIPGEEHPKAKPLQCAALCQCFGLEMPWAFCLSNPIQGFRHHGCKLEGCLVVCSDNPWSTASLLQSQIHLSDISTSTVLPWPSKAIPRSANETLCIVLSCGCQQDKCRLWSLGPHAVWQFPLIFLLNHFSWLSWLFCLLHQVDDHA